MDVDGLVIAADLVGDFASTPIIITVSGGSWKQRDSAALKGLKPV